eukprot:TRINITY_DN25436_c0_g1_i2.p1 TRINITY_DN25436_c0_g1~~TRINITY_DN25436_c0_g1_i2.p1  ORF type:complete len:260 (-),score=43.31 TRINITY_DN25436_c0_g1_i2:146-925(-)
MASSPSSGRRQELSPASDSASRATPTARAIAQRLLRSGKRFSFRRRQRAATRLACYGVPACFLAMCALVVPRLPAAFLQQAAQATLSPPVSPGSFAGKSLGSSGRWRNALVRAAEPQDADVAVEERLELGQRLSGTVTRVMTYGALVDIDSKWHGLVPLEKMVAGDWIPEDAGEYVHEGQTIDVWVSKVGEDALELSMVEGKVGPAEPEQPPEPLPERRPVSSLQVGEQLAGRVTRSAALVCPPGIICALSRRYNSARR